ncbi:MAG: hypothetical protein ACI8VT_001695 [Saprospiraceae bacterium]|jgi:hypothetical protein
MENNNYNIKLDPEKLSSGEIGKHKDFDGLLQQFQTPQTPKSPLKPLYYLAGALAAALVGALLYFNWAGDTGGFEELSTPQFLASQPYINPPFEKVEKAFGLGQLDANAGGTYTYENGTKVIVPTAAFLDDQGNLVSGEVDIKYREYHDYIDFFVSGIPMEYDSAGTQYNLESAGMMEIYAEQDGKRLNIAPGKNINVEMVSEIMVAANDRANIPKFNVYSLDEEKRNWVYEGQDQMEILEEDITNLLRDGDKIEGEASEPIAEYQNLLVKIQQGETTELATIEATIARPLQPVKPERENGNDYVFNLKFADEDIVFSSRSNPTQAERALDQVQDEINQLHRQYENTLWQVSPQVTGFNQQMVEQTNWDDAKIERLNNRDYKLTLINPDKTIEVIVNPVLSANDYNNAIADFDQQMAAFTQQLADRELQLAAQKQDLIRRLKKERAIAKKSYEEKLAYYQAQGNVNAAAELMITNKVMNRFTVSQFGIWNCDRPLPPFIYNIKGAFVENKSKKQFKHNTAFLIDKNKNTVLRFYASENANVTYDSKSENMMWMITKENKIAMCSPDRFKEIKQETRAHTFVMDLVDQTINSEEDLRKILTF